ncbi:thaumatin-like protein 1b [Coccinella septempunctata]|uniref:thaumatin-like protein 1b n=1 Tax=Coccinella septempunctata TaxID=41139 RepID=UPI001D061EFE|nr:thaumatin-like protein 1b [Coccinella septempunctata]
MNGATVCLVIGLFGSTLAIQYQIKNNAGGEIWVGIQGNPGHPHLNNGGFKLSQNQQKTVNAPDDWAGRFWARTWCDGGSNHCLTGDCGNKLECNGAGGNPPATLLEITQKGNAGLDYYDVSLVDGFNLKASMTPQGGQGDGSQYSCKKAGCDTDINQKCPGELQLKNGQGQVIGCKSACLAFNTDEYCCRGAHDRPETCKASDWPKNYPQQFKELCPDAYSYAYDDHKSTFTCKNVPVYSITFG